VPWPWPLHDTILLSLPILYVACITSCIAIKDGRGGKHCHRIAQAIVWVIKGGRGMPKQGGCLRIKY